ncbi:polysaccharide deacetylase family protein [Egicoccus halophilus]|uniref:polysaccharide deacetylase family protein n=1 Tax=Egicoccus halophilus TaxID=1670830 RepID=UPI001031ECFD|nr:polysaccharide deacetylase family protein [Egicoccus halophilus]
MEQRVAQRVAAASAGRRGRGLVLLWHRVRPEGPGEDEVVRSVATADLAEQLDVLRELGDVVALAELEHLGRRRRPAFALTFDDDDPGHVRETLPLLRARDLPATFFLSGRWRTAAGPYWWEHLESCARSSGVATVAAALGLAPTTDVRALAGALTGTPGSLRLTSRATGGSDTMTRDQAGALVAAGMEIGFHTFAHPSLPSLPDAALRAALTAGRDELAAELATPLRRFAYPHGHADARVAAATRDAGYLSAWTTAKRVARADDEPMRRGRWDLGHLPIDRFRTTVLRGLARPWD